MLPTKCEDILVVCLLKYQYRSFIAAELCFVFTSIFLLEWTISTLLQRRQTFLFTKYYVLRYVVVVVVAHIYSPVTGQRQTLNIGRSTHFLLH